MDRWNFEWWHFFGLYAALVIINAVMTLLEKEIGFISAYLIIFVLVVSPQVFYHARKKKATPKEGSTMDRWNFEWRHALVLYAALIVTNAVFAILEQEIGFIGGYLTILAMCLVASLLYHARRKNAIDAD